MPGTCFLVTNIVLPFDRASGEACDRACARLSSLLHGCSIENASVYKRSLDCRRRPDIRAVYSILAEADCKDDDAKRAAENADIQILNNNPFQPETLHAKTGTEKLSARPVIVGLGPCGMFAALLMAENGYRPIVLERGDSIDARRAAVQSFRKTRVLDLDSNVQFGAGGAGTFSDGKLTTRINDPNCRYVLQRMVEFGADEQILTEAKPHLGTDTLPAIVKNLTARIEAFGGEIHYRTTLLDINPQKESVRLSTSAGEIDAGVLLLAPGHSARDTYEMLSRRAFTLAPKAFSIGLRIEHLQTEVDRAIYGTAAGNPLLPPADYTLSHRNGERGVYSFCMCPGGEVVAAASESGGVVVNGMSNRRRSGVNANAAIAVSVLPQDFGNSWEGAIRFQRSLERAAFTAGGGAYRAPASTVGDFLNGTCGTKPTRVTPSYLGGDVTLCRLDRLLPSFAVSMLREGIMSFGRTQAGFDAPYAMLTGIETRTSAPLRIMRTNERFAEGFSRVFPCGEGAGYAGGITSAACDGLQTALCIMQRFAPNDKT